MATPQAVYTQVRDTLKNAAGLSYMKQVFDGLRRGVPAGDYPCLMLEPTTNLETPAAYPILDGHLHILIAAYMRDFDVDAQLLGDANYKGIFTLELDVKKALGAQYPTLGLSGLLEFEFPTTEYERRSDLAEFPVRGVLIEVDVHYRTQLDTRT